MNESRIGKLPANVFLWLDPSQQTRQKYWQCYPPGWKGCTRWNVENIWFVSGLSGIMVDECFSALSLVILMIFSFCPEVQCITMSGLLFTNIRRTLDITPRTSKITPSYWDNYGSKPRSQGVSIYLSTIFLFSDFIFSNQPQQFPARVELVNTFPKQTPGNSALLSRLSWDHQYSNQSWWEKLP